MKTQSDNLFMMIILTNNGSYRLIATLQTIKNGKTEQNSYEKTIEARFLKRLKAQSFYDKESGRNYVDPSNVHYVYELETTKVKLFPSPRLAQVTEFLRATHYRYDWAQIAINTKGKPSRVQNMGEIQNRWETMKTKLTNDEIGMVVEIYLKKLDKLIYTDKPMLPAIAQYLYFGLVFPNIPIKHKSEWQNTRNIEFSEIDNELFEETVKYIGEESGIQSYQIEGRTKDESKTQLLKFEGIIKRKKEQMLPESTQVEIEYSRDTIMTKWKFELYRVLL